MVLTDSIFPPPLTDDTEIVTMLTWHDASKGLPQFGKEVIASVRIGCISFITVAMRRKGNLGEFWKDLLHVKISQKNFYTFEALHTDEVIAWAELPEAVTCTRNSEVPCAKSNKE